MCLRWNRWPHFHLICLNLTFCASSYSFWASVDEKPLDETLNPWAAFVLRQPWKVGHIQQFPALFNRKCEGRFRVKKTYQTLNFTHIKHTFSPRVNTVFYSTVMWIKSPNLEERLNHTQKDFCIITCESIKKTQAVQKRDAFMGSLYFWVIG